MNARDPELQTLLREATRGYAAATRLAEELQAAVDDLREYIGKDFQRDDPPTEG